MKRKPLKIFLSVDVEPRLGKSIETFGETLPIGMPSLCGVPFITETLEKFDAKAIYFTEALHHHYFKNVLLDYLQPFLNSPHIEVGLHIHPAWLFFKDKIVRSDNCSDFSSQELAGFINDGLEYLKKYVDKPISYFRSGNLSSSKALFSALKQTKFKYVSTSSMVYGDKIHKYCYAPYACNKVLDVPVTSFYRSGYKPQLWSITGVSHIESSMLLKQAYDKGCEFVMIITHPFEFLTPSGKPLRGNQSRLMALCQFVKDNPDKFEFAVDINSLSPCSDIILKSNPMQYGVSLMQSKVFEIF
jgi:hypothetical protein